MGTAWIQSGKPDCTAWPFRRDAPILTAGRVRDGHFTRTTLHYPRGGQSVVDQPFVADRPPDQAWGILFRGRCE